MFAVTRRLAVDIGPRVAGTPAEAAARDYIETLLRSYGYTVTEQSFGFDASAFLPARVNVGAEALPALAFTGSPPAAVSGTLAPAGIGRAADMPADLRGKIALMRRGGVPFNDMVGNAAAAGATAAIVYNNVPGRLSAEVGAVAIPAVTLTQRDGQALVAKASAGPVQATVVVSMPRGTAYNVLAKPNGTTTCATVTGGHYDSVPVTGGADDNAAGTAAVIEVARLAAARRLLRANCFVLFGAEEFGLFGSKQFVRALTPEARAGLKAMLNLDVVGVSTPLGVLGDSRLVAQARVQAQRAGVQVDVATLPPGAASDHVSFADAGVPVVMFTREDGLIHTPQDAMDRIQLSSLSDVATAAYATLAALNAP
ncbi:MAG: M20/M25/M40 family metallo-hydrolase [Dehalococcoidia bacterium]|nr:M20/M25/M40 family metallo-hydrolase [Dehalococcoidia bacterium]